MAVLIDRLDTLKMIYDPDQSVRRAYAGGHERKRDEIIMEKFFAVAKTGKTGDVDAATRPPTPSRTAATGFTRAKLRALRKLMKKAEPRSAVSQAADRGQRRGDRRSVSVRRRPPVPTMPPSRPWSMAKSTTSWASPSSPFEDYNGTGHSA